MEISIDTRDVKKLKDDLKRLANASFTQKEKQTVGNVGAAVIRPIIRDKAKKRAGNTIGIFYARGQAIYGAIPKNMSKTLNTLNMKRMYGALLGARMDNSNPSGTYRFVRSGKTIPVFGRTIGSSYASYAYIAYGGRSQWESQLLSPSIAVGGSAAQTAMSTRALEIYEKKLKRNGF